MHVKLYCNFQLHLFMSRTAQSCFQVNCTFATAD